MVFTNRERSHNMSPTERAEINRANSQHSTGPKTEEGKRRSPLNSLRHGLTGQIVVLPNEDLDAYHHVKSINAESNLVQALADTLWRLNRIAVLETNLLTLAIERNPDPIPGSSEQARQGLALAAAYESQEKTIANLGIHTQRLCRRAPRRPGRHHRNDKI